MSVPAILINKTKLTFGAQSIEKILDLIDEGE